jgi:hypothetical protein
MGRIFGIVLAVWLVHCLALGASAQQEAPISPGTGSLGSAPIDDAAQRGFGFQYTQVAPAYSSELYGPTSFPPEYETPYVAPGGHSAAPDVPYSGRGYDRAPLPYRQGLPRGRLYWPEEAMAPDYSPLRRYQSYDYDYERGGYGSSFYGGFYKGYLLGY